MPFKSKRALAQIERMRLRKLLQEQESRNAAAVAPSGESEQRVREGPSSEPANLEMVVEDEHSSPLEAKVEIKEEDFPMELQTPEEDVTQPDPENTADPIGQDSSQLLLPLKKSTRKKSNDMCRFCLQLLGESYVLRQTVIAVLGYRTSKMFAPSVKVKCCTCCQNLFNQFYEFKQSCLTALTQSEKLLAKRPKARRTKASKANKVSSKEDNVNSANQHLSETKLCVSSSALNSENPETWYSCGRCSKRFVNEACYIRHKPFCTKKSGIPRKQQMQCPQCPKKFRVQENFDHHINWHNGIRSIRCQREGCDKTFITMGGRQRHEETCGQEMLCNICGALFQSKSDLRNHLIVHADPKFVCEVCHKGFHKKAALIRHTTVHTGERNFPCEACGKRFKSQEAHRVHQRIHTQQKPYQCPVCGDRFRLNCLLKVHFGKMHAPGEKRNDLLDWNYQRENW